MGRQSTRFVVVVWVAVVLAAVSCGTVDPADSRGHAGSAGTAPSAGDGNAGGSGASADGGGGGGGTVPPGGAPTDGGGGPVAGDGGGGMPDPGVDEPLLPWRVGNSWTYRITKNGVVTEKTTVVGEEEAVGGKGPNAAVLA